MRLVFGNYQKIADWVGERCGVEFYTVDSAIGIANDVGEMVGGYVFTGHDRNGIELSLAGRAVVYRGGWCAVIDYVFRQIGCVRLQSHTKRSNKPVLRMLADKKTGLGWRFEGVARRYYGNEDGMVYSLTVDDLPAFIERWKLRIAHHGFKP